MWTTIALLKHRFLILNYRMRTESFRKIMTPLYKQDKSPIKHLLKPGQLNFKVSTPSRKDSERSALADISINYGSFGKTVSDNFSRKPTTTYDRIARATFTTERTLQFANTPTNKNGKPSQNICPFQQMPLNQARPLVALQVNPQAGRNIKLQKRRSLSLAPLPAKCEFTRKFSRNCPEQVGESKLAKYMKMPKLNLASSVSINDFQKGKLLGKGYFGSVFLVRHKETGFVCALKELSKEKVAAQKVQEQLVRQIKIHSYVNHENIISMYGFFSDAKNVYILQEVAQTSLFSILNKHKMLPEPQVVNYLKDTLRGLKYLHRNDISHRDIKPENILISYDGKTKLCDFGWAVYDPCNFRKSNVGTLLYMSPENIIGKGYDSRNDIWAVGIMGYQLLTGSIPFNMWTQQDRTKIVTEQVRFPQYIQISKKAQKFVLKMLQKDSNNRAEIHQLLHDEFLM